MRLHFVTDWTPDSYSRLFSGSIDILRLRGDGVCFIYWPFTNNTFVEPSWLA